MSKVNPLVKYVRDSHHHRVGVVVALSKDKIGWSRCNKKDTFSKEWGKELAMIRAINLLDRPLKVPQSMTAAMTEMEDRAQRYYQEGYVEEYMEENCHEDAKRLR